MISLPLKKPEIISVTWKGVGFSILLDTCTPFGFGTKIRKALGFYDEIKKLGCMGVQLCGDPNSNFLAAFTYFFYTQKIPVFALHHSRSGYRGPNRIISERFAHKVLSIPGYTDDTFRIINPEFKTNADILPIPRWGFDKLSLIYMISIWDIIQDIDKINTLYIDIGSGLTYLSAIHHLTNKQVKVIGVCLGLKRSKMEEYLKKMEKSLFGTVSSYTLLDGTDSFGRLNQVDRDEFQKMRSSGIPVEPVYSYHSIQRIAENEKKGDSLAFYLHQGGMLSGITRGE